MNMKSCLPTSLIPLYLALLLFIIPLTSWGAPDMENLLPPLSCGTGWKIEGKPLFYDQDTLSDRINGEAELYLPYGFERMAAARYAQGTNAGAGIDVEIYRMGSLLDAFGMYANYRQKDGRSIHAGAESNLSSTQLYFYQGRHFVHIQLTGIDANLPGVLTECAQAVASRLPGTKELPSGLSAINRPEIVKGTERYLPQSLLGYDFLNRGLMADAVINGSNLQVFILLASTPESTSVAFDGYRSQLSRPVIETTGKGTVFLEGDDPLYGPVILLRKGGCLAGALKFSGKAGVRSMLERICK
jgi:hypothetical protein